MYVLVNIVNNTRHDITDSPFEVHEDFVWIEVSADEVSEEAYFDPDSGAIVDPQAIPETLEQAFTRRKQELKQYRNDKIKEGFNIPSTPLTLALTETTERRLTGASEKAKEAIASSTEFTVDWEVDDDNWIQLDAATIVLLADLAATHIQACYTQNKFHFNQLETLYNNSNTQGLIDYDFTTGW